MIEIKKVSKRFDKIAAVSDVSLSIEQGQVFGLLGKKENTKALIPANSKWRCRRIYRYGQEPL